MRINFINKSTVMNEWNENWTKADPIGSGGQGAIHRVVNIKTGKNGTLKILKMQKDLERRSRMFREVMTLISLQNYDLSIPKVIEHNLNSWNDVNSKLYVIFEYIDGITLNDYLDTYGKQNIDISIKFIKSIINTITICHNNEIVHRDIKPDNIILRNRNLLDPFLIDFGLTFNASIETMPTEINQQIGNRFLTLPELISPSSDLAVKRQYVSDITQLVGILFYLITGEQPATLLDSAGKMPHKRKSYLYKNDSKALNVDSLFDVGFSYESYKRINSCNALSEFLSSVENERNDVSNETEQALRAFKAKINEESLKQLRFKEEKCDEILKLTIHRFKKYVGEKTEQQFVANESGRYNGPYNGILGIYHYGVNIHEPRDYTRYRRVHFIGYWRNSNFELSIEYDGNAEVIEASGLGSELLVVDKAESRFDALTAKMISDLY